MARHATILRQVEDIWGDLWDVREERQTPHGWPLCLGWPAKAARGKGGGGGPRAIVTEPLTTYLASVRHDPACAVAELPLGRTALKRLRAVLGHHWRDDRALFWIERIADLADLTGPAFAARHGVTPSAASLWRVDLLGRRVRPPGWWREPDTAEVIETWATAAAADALEIAAQSVRRLRAVLRAETARNDREDAQT